MRIDKVWCVCDPTRESTLADICFESTLAGIERQFKGGLTMAQNPTLFTERAEAEAEAHLRLVAMRATDANRDAAPHEAMRSAASVALRDRDRKVLAELARGTRA